MISVSFLKSKFSREKTLEKINKSIASLIHVDLMDGEYVLESNLPFDGIIQDLKKTTKLLDLHLMVKEPLKYLDKLTKLNVWCITFHLDSTNEPLEVINYLKKKNIKVGIAINPKDDIKILSSYYNLIDYCLIMSVNPGKGGQKFMEEVLPKIKEIPKNILVGIDGGINENTIKKLNNYKVDVIVSGSYVAQEDDYDKQINKLLK